MSIGNRIFLKKPEAPEALLKVTTGKVYWNVLNKERRGEYLGSTVQVIPHTGCSSGQIFP